MQFVDANVFVRLLTGDDPTKARRCFTLFQRVKRGELTLTTSEAVIAEVVYVLSSKVYRLPPREIAVHLRPVLTLPGLKFLYRRVFLRALELYALHNIDFEDCLSAAHMERQKITDIYTYDRDFDRISAIKRLEP